MMTSSEFTTFATILTLVIGVPILWVVISRQVARDQREQAEEAEQRLQRIREKYQHLSVEDLVMLEPEEYEVVLAREYVLRTVHHLTDEEIAELLKSAEQAKKKAKLGSLKRGIRQKAYQTYGVLPVDDGREPIAEDVRSFVWNRDGGKCAKCGSREKLEFDHIVPVAKGGSNTARNLELLCERCNREKSDTL